MKVAHFAVWGPNKCGLYHTAKELVLAERLAGIDARFIAYDEKGIQTDGSFKSEKLDWSYGADVLVRHSSIPQHLRNAGIPTVLVLHGRPESSVRIEQQKIMKVVSSIRGCVSDERYKAFIVLWPEFMDIWSNIVPTNKLFYIPAMVDLDEYKPDNEPFDLAEYNSSPNVLLADIWRDDVIPFNVLFAAEKFVKKHGGKVHIAGLPKSFLNPVGPFLISMKDKGTVGHIFGQIKHIKGMYIACDIMVTPHVIATRSIRECLASNTPIVAGSGCRFTPHQANPKDIDSFAEAIERCWQDKSQKPREVAEKEFNLEQAGQSTRKVFEKILKKKSKKRKVMIDLGGHLGETVRRFYREKADAAEYEIYTFEPDLDTFKKLDAQFGHVRNINLINAMMGKRDGMADFFIGRMNENEGGTSIKGKQTGKVDYEKPIKVESVNLARWLRSNINKEDHVILKMNIEGGEYDLMEYMLDEDLTGMIDKCFIQLHAHKFGQGRQRQRFHQIEARFWNEANCKKFIKNKGFYSFSA